MSADVAEVVWYNEDSASPLTVSKPAAFASGQILVAVFCAHGTTLADMTAPSGWTASGTTWQVAGVTYGKVFYHVFAGGDPSTWDFPYGAGDDVCLGLFRITGADTTPTLVVGATPITSIASSDDSPSVTPTGTDDLLICTLADIGSGSALVETDPSGMTDRSQTQIAGNFMALAGASQQLASGSATGVKTWTSVTPTGVGGGTFSIAIKSAAGGAGILDPRTQIVPQVGQPRLPRPIVSPATIGPPQVIRLAPIVVVQNPRVRPGPAPQALTPRLLPAQVRPLPPIVVVPQAQIPQLRGLSVSPPQAPAAPTTPLSLTVTVVPEQFRSAVVAPIVLTPPPLPQALAPITVVGARSQPPLAATITLTPPPLPQGLPPIVVVTSTWQPRQPQIFLSQPSAPPIVPVLAVVPTLVAPTFRFRPGPGPFTLTPPLLPVSVRGVSGDGRIVTVSTAERYTSTDADGRTASTTGHRVTSTDAAGRIVSTTDRSRP